MANTDPGQYTTPTEQPLQIRSAADVQWHDEADIVVVGFGGAGATAAIRGREMGLDVIAVDRFDGGGATAYSGGVTYAGNTAQQREAGVDDSVENMYAYLSQEENPVRPETLRRFCENSGAQLEWLQAQGVPYDSAFFKGKTTYPPEGSYLYYSGNEKVPAYAAGAKPAARGHRAVGAGFTGYVHFGALRTSASQKGVRLVKHSPVRRLVMDSSGAVIGVEVLAIPESAWPEHDKLYAQVNPMKPMNGARSEKAIAQCRAFEDRFTERRLIRARGGVILSTGGFVNDMKKLEAARPFYAKSYKSIMRLGSMGCDGSGMDLGRSVGGAIDLMENFFNARSIAPPQAALRGVLVNKQGGRFLNEDAYTGFLGTAIGDQTDGKAWLILDKDSFWATFKQCAFPGKGLYLYTLPTLLNIFIGGTKRARTLDKLARKMKIDAAALKKTVASANAGAAAGVDPLGKAQENIDTIDKPPYYAINMDFDNRFTVTMLFSLGGLKVNEDSGAVLRPDGTDIPGLYAAGRVAVGLNSINNISGMSLADTVFSGLRAAEGAAKGLNTHVPEPIG
ncbi:3-oxo-5alpha-steroid 4-dehydrogenase [Sphingobium faniae]|nr:3-oxo-5alpha-steroid 4-dehydrogenase [Sphingobium faniae]